MSRQDLKNSRRLLQEGKSSAEILSKINNGDSAGKSRIASVLRREEGLLGKVVVDASLLKDCPAMHGVMRKACISQDPTPMSEISGDSGGASTILFVLETPDCRDCPKNNNGTCGEVNRPIISSVDQMGEGAIDSFGKMLVDGGIATASEVTSQIGEEDPFVEVARLASWASQKRASKRIASFAGEIRAEVEDGQMGSGASLDDVMVSVKKGQIQPPRKDEFFEERNVNRTRTAGILDSLDSLTGMDLELQTLSDLSETAAFDSDGGYGDLEDRSFGSKPREASEDPDFRQAKQEQLEVHLKLVSRNLADGKIRLAHVTPLLKEIETLSSGLKIPKKFQGTVQQLKNMLGDLG